MQTTIRSILTVAAAAAAFAAACDGQVSDDDDDDDVVSPDGGGDPTDGGGGGGPDATPSPLQGWCQVPGADFSFFVTSMNALWTLSGDPIDDWSGGFGGDFGGLAGADEICQTIGAATGHGDRTWRAFLSATDDGSGNPVHAIERIGAGPWHDANGRLVATGLAGLTSGDRPDGDAQSVTDLPDECGVPTSALGDAHDVVTASDTSGHLFSTNPNATCNDWTSSSGTVGAGGGLLCGHSFPRESGFGGQHWLSDHPLRGCGKGANLEQNGPGSGTCIGCSGGYGAVYCFAADG